ncbi:hypothetical protein [Clostridium sp.]|uniref:hypothetical protein n=1 Tax=Clostridium sp. TaxID=1506 RepID=UPI001A572A3F|nr:hypothetical protein [Clostridium sp.]MBK5243056.1 hypothetical protein [Clostridium sp.]
MEQTKKYGKDDLYLKEGLLKNKTKTKPKTISKLLELEIDYLLKIEKVLNR